MIDKYLDLAREQKQKTVEHENDGDTNCHWCPWNSLQKPGKETKGTADQRQNWDHSDHRLEYIEESYRLRLNEKPPVKTDVKHSQGVK